MEEMRYTSVQICYQFCPFQGAQQELEKSVSVSELWHI